MLTFNMALLILLLAALTVSPPLIAKKHGKDCFLWCLATIATGFIPGLIAAVLFRNKKVPAVEGFIIGSFLYLVGSLALLVFIFVRP